MGLCVSFFFFSSRRLHTRCSRDWSSDVCSSDLTSVAENNVSRRVQNDVAFPYSCIVRLKFPKQETLPAFDLFWYDGGMKPETPEELGNGSLEPEGMMFVGDKGKIIAGFRCENPKLLPEAKMKAYLNGMEVPKEVNESGDKYWIN